MTKLSEIIENHPVIYVSITAILAFGAGWVAHQEVQTAGERILITKQEKKDFESDRNLLKQTKAELANTKSSAASLSEEVAQLKTTNNALKGNSDLLKETELSLEASKNKIALLTKELSQLEVENKENINKLNGKTGELSSLRFQFDVFKEDMEAIEPSLTRSDFKAEPIYPPRQDKSPKGVFLWELYRKVFEDMPYVGRFNCTVTVSVDSHGNIDAGNTVCLSNAQTARAARKLQIALINASPVPDPPKNFVSEPFMLSFEAKIP